MNKWNTAALIAADKEYLWHRFTPMHVLGKALTGGSLPLAITLVAEAIFLEFSNI
jgi:hypothetical protein